MPSCRRMKIEMSDNRPLIDDLRILHWYPSPDFSSRRKSRLTLDDTIFAEVASLLGAGREFVARAATGRTEPKAKGGKARSDIFDRNAVLIGLRLERRRVLNLVDAMRSPDGSVFELRAPDQLAGLIGEPVDGRIMEFVPPRRVEYLQDDSPHP